MRRFIDLLELAIWTSLLLVAGCATLPAHGQPFRHPPDIAATDRPDCTADRDGRLLSLTGASSATDCTDTGGGTSTALCHCQQTSAGVYGWVAAGSGGGTDDQTATEVAYTPTTPADWTDPDPTEVGGALDALAAGGVGGGAPTDAEYVVAAADGTLSAERVLQAGTGSTVTTGVGTIQIDVDDDGHAHTGATLSGVDISDDTNLAVTAPLALTGDTVGVSAATESASGVVELATSAETTAGLAVQASDTRLSDDRAPTAHASTHEDAGADELALDASQVTTGTVATARLGSGTADSTTYLRGDQTWAAVAAGQADTFVWATKESGAADQYFWADTDATETVVDVQAPVAGTFTGMRCTTEGAPGAGDSWVFTLRKNAASTALTCTVADSATECSDVANTAAIVAGDDLAIFADAVGSPFTAAATCTLAFQVEGGGGGGSSTASYARINLTANESISNVSTTAIPWDLASEDVDGYWSAGTPTRLTIPVGLEGLFDVRCYIDWDSNSTGRRQVALYVNGGGDDYLQTEASPANLVHHTAGILRLSDGDYVECKVYQDSSATRDVEGRSRITILRLGD